MGSGGAKMVPFKELALSLGGLYPEVDSFHELDTLTIDSSSIASPIDSLWGLIDQQYTAGCLLCI